jgi:two-component system chemotaxis family response regulator WspR
MSNPTPDFRSFDIVAMLIDDQAIVAKLIQNALAECNDINFHYCPKPTIAIEEIESVNPTVILLDLCMPEMGGIELLKLLRGDEKKRNIPVIVLSTEDNPLTKKESFENGANDYLVKLPDKNELIARLRYHSQAYIHKLQLDEVVTALHKANEELEKRNLDLLQISQLDGMTQLANRRHFDEKILVELKRAIRNQMPLGVIMMDIDHFKLYNDTYGHLQGDECLKAVAYKIKTNLKRATDLAARYGGEEFIVLLPDTDLLGSVKVAEDIRAAILAEKIPHKSSLTAEHVTISMGVHSCIPTLSDTPETLLKTTDSFLYKAKEGGRNQVFFSNS